MRIHLTIVFFFVVSVVVAQPYFTHVDTNHHGIPGIIKTNTGFIAHTGYFLSNGYRASKIEVRDAMGEIVHSYTPFDTAFPTYPYSPMSINLLADSSYVIFAYQDTNTIPSQAQMFSLVKKYDKDHNAIWEKKYFGNNYAHGFQKLIHLSNGNYAMVGFTLDTEFGYAQGTLVFFDSDFNILDIHEYGGSNTDDLRSIVEVEGKGLFIAGIEYIFPSEGWVCTLRRVDYDGNLIWKKIFSDNGGPKQHTGHRIILLRDNTLFSIIKVQPQFNALNYKTFGKRISLDGEVIVEFELDNSLLLNDAFRGLCEASDGSLIVGGIGSSLSSNDQTIDIMKVDPLGNTLWEKAYEFDPLGYDLPYEFDFEDENNLIFTGFYNTVNNVQSGIVMQLNCNGEDGTFYPVHDTCAYYDCTDKPMNTSFTADKTFLDLSQDNGLVQFENISPNTISREWHMDDGTVYYTLNNPEHQFIYNGIHHVHLISNHGVCTDTTWMDIEVINGVNSTSEFQLSKLKLYPNPAGQMVNISSEENIQSIEIYSSIGRRVKALDINKKQIHLNVKDLESGVYNVFVIDASGRSSFEKLMVK